MSLKLEGRKCVVCESYLFEEDDVVFCPDCGAPHHRDCWQSVGNCKLAELHGTPDEYKYTEEPVEAPIEEKKESNTCRRCGKELEENVQFCPYCGAGNMLNTPQYANAVYGAALNTEEQLEDGTKINEVLRVVTLNAGRYILKFKSLVGGKKLSWNWAAFLVPHGWFAFRKMYVLAAVIGALMVASSLLSLPMMEAVQSAPLTDNMTRAETIEVMSKAMAAAPRVAKIFAVASGVFELVIRIFSALFADFAYKKHVLGVCSEIRAADDKHAATRKLGGVNPFAFLLTVFAVSMLYDILTVFLV